MRVAKLGRFTAALFAAFSTACGGSELGGPLADAPDSADTADTSGEVSNDTAGTDVDTSPDVEPDTTPDVEPDTTPDVEPDTTPDTTPDVEPDTTADASDTTPDVPDTTPDVEPDTLADVPDTTPDVEPDTLADTVTPGSGESCEDPRVVTVPATFTAPIEVTGDTTGLADDHSVEAGVCAGLPWVEGVDASDEVWAFTARSAGVYRVTLTSDEADLGLYALTSCPASGAPTCASGSDIVGLGAANADTIAVTLAAGETIFVVVDAYTDESIPAVAGAYTLSFAPPTAVVPGDSCGNALSLTLSGDAWVGAGDNGAATGLTDNYNGLACDVPGFFGAGSGVQDQVFRFVAPTAGTWVATATPTDTADLVLYAFEGEACGSSCAGEGADAGFDGDPEEITLADLAAGEELFIVVDAFAVAMGGPFTLSVAPGCAPTCAAGTCGGDDGCGGTCGCGEGEVCQDGACVEPPLGAGDDCTEPGALTEGAASWTAAGDLSAPDIADDFRTTGCTSFVEGGYVAQPTVAAPDQVYALTVPTSGRYRITLRAEGDLYWQLMAGPTCAAASCVGVMDEALAGEDETFTVQLEAGTSYWLVVDTFAPMEVTPFTLDVRPECTPTCEPGACGAEDGCGGTCGCGPGSTCEAGACVTPPGETCDEALALTADADGAFGASGDLSGRADNVTTEGCEQLGFGSSGAFADVAFTFTPTTTGSYEVELTSVAPADHIFTLFEGPGCAASACMGYVDTNTFEETVDRYTFALTADTPYTLVVDAWSAGSAGAFDLVIRPACTPVCAEGACNVDDGCGGTCGCARGEICNASNTCESLPVADGDGCAKPFALPSTGADEWQAEGDLADNTDLVLTGSCPNLGAFKPSGDGTVDEVWSFRTTTAGTYRVTLSSPLDLFFMVFEGPGCQDAACLGAMDRRPGGSDEVALLELLADTEYTVVVDQFSSTIDGGTYTLVVDRPCLPTCTEGVCGNDDGCGGTCGCGVDEVCEANACVPAPEPEGDSCVAPMALTETATGLGGAGDLTTMSDDFSTLGCVSFVDGGFVTDPFAGSPDEVFELTVGATGDYTITLDAPADLYWQLMVGPTCAEATCLGVMDEGITGVERFTVTLEADLTYWLVVDAYQPLEVSAFTLTVEEACTPVCEAGSCNVDDGCGGTCGCGPREVCNANNQCEAAPIAPGDTCATAGTVTLTEPVLYDTCTMFRDLEVFGPGCAAPASAGPDAVASFTASEAGDYWLELEGDGQIDGVLNVVVADACPELVVECAASSDTLSVIEGAAVTLAAGETAWLIASGYAAIGPASCGLIELRVSPIAAEVCDDEVDNDRDGAIDCADDECATTPTCDEAANGADACTNTLDDDGDGFTDCADRDCAEDPTACPNGMPGDSCAAPIAVTTETWSELYDTCQFADDFTAVEGGTCAGNGLGTQSRDLVIAFTAPTAGTYDVVVDDTFDSIVNVVDGASGCPGASLSTCLDGGDDPAEATFTATAGATYFIVVDAWGSACGLADVSISKRCVPSCAPGSCDVSDGCGGTCGCAAGEVCNTTTDTCEEPLPAEGESCDNPGELAEDAPVLVDTCTFASDFDFEVSDCAAPTVGAPDVVVSFTAPRDGDYLFELEGDGVIDGVLNLVRADACPAVIAACDAASDGFDDLEAATLTLAAGETVWVFATGYEGLGADCGLVELRASFVPPPPDTGDSCAEPYTLAAGTAPATFEGLGDLTAANVGDDFDTVDCAPFVPGGVTADGLDTPDEVFALTVPTSGDYVVTVVSDLGTDPYWALLEGDTCAEAACLGYVDEAADGEDEVFTVTLDAAKRYYLVVDTYDVGSAGPYLVFVEPAPCVPACDGTTCDDDGCGGTCECAAGTTCDEQTLTCECVPECDGTTCGDDGCGGTCACATGTTCDEQTLTCECVPACDGTTCGDDGCGGTCACAPGTVCDAVTELCEAPQPVVIAAWTFGTASPGTLLATTFSPRNEGKAVSSTASGTIAYPGGYGGGSNVAASNSGWDNGVGTKAWRLELDTTGFSDIVLVTSRHGGSNTGPRDFALQYSLDGTAWADVQNGAIQLTRGVNPGTLDTWGSLLDLPLPAAVADKATVFLRWVVTSTTAINGNTVQSGGTNRIDEIVIEGTPIPVAP